MTEVEVVMAVARGTAVAPVVVVLVVADVRDAVVAEGAVVTKTNE